MRAFWTCAVIAALSAGCVSTRAIGPLTGSCQGPPVEFGTQTRSWLTLRVVTESGRPFLGFWARWRKYSYLLLSGPWSDWEQSGADSEGVFGITDMEEGVYEIEVCPPGCEPLHGFVDVRYAVPNEKYPIAPVVARMGPEALAAAGHCGVQLGEGVSEAQATCIAVTAGLPAGLEPWIARIDPAQPGQNSARWEILSTTDAGPECPGGEEMIVDARDGRVIGPVPWNCHLNGSVRRPR
jgi:hypothetical protein